MRNGQAGAGASAASQCTTRLMKELDYGKDYQYAHDTEEKLTRMQCLPDSLAGTTYYHPTDQGKEAAVKERLQKIRGWKNQNA